MPEGIIQFYLEKKGYGYIRVPETREEFYFTKKALTFPVEKGQIVQFKISEDQQGLFATDIKPITQNPEQPDKFD